MLGKLIENEHEAIEAIKSNMPTSGYYMLRESLEMAIQALEEIQQYRAIGTVEECRAAVERQKPKKVKNKKVQRNFAGNHHTITAITGDCQKCGCVSIRASNTDYCPACGRAIDWTEGE